MPLKFDDYAHACVISLTGDFVGADTAQVRAAVDERLMSRRAVNFVIDFEPSHFISSEGLETLLAIRRQCEERRGQVKLAGLDESCRKILEITRLDRHFECHPDLQTAMK
ncbi:MAG TPA: STAS domain-containing protein [Tepidisphaeraceae bacterium]|nr:STAS domain-containing protein [Tepidisphaeraceae bacterium]